MCKESSDRLQIKWGKGVWEILKDCKDLSRVVKGTSHEPPSVKSMIAEKPSYSLAWPEFHGDLQHHLSIRRDYRDGVPPPDSQQK